MNAEGTIGEVATPLTAAQMNLITQVFGAIETRLDDFIESGALSGRDAEVLYHALAVSETGELWAVSDAETEMVKRASWTRRTGPRCAAGTRPRPTCGRRCGGRSTHNYTLQNAARGPGAPRPGPQHILVRR